MRISENEATSIQSLGAALREQLLFEYVREDDHLALSDRLSELRKKDSRDRVSSELLGLLTSVALAEKSRRCLEVLLPLVDPGELTGSLLSRVVEKGNVEALQIMRDYCAFDEETMLRCVERAAFMGQDQVLSSLLEGFLLPEDFQAPYREAILRRHLPCLEVLVRTQSNSIANQECLVEACARGQQDMISFLAPYGDMVLTVKALIKVHRDNAATDLQFTDSLCEEFVPDDKLPLIADEVIALASPGDSMPRTFARLAKMELLSSAPLTARPAPGNRL